jgi:outer membrane protein assembly factor BamB
MKSRLHPLLFCALLPVAAASGGDWPWWRGPQRDGIAAPGQEPPVDLGAPDALRWSADVPGRAHGSACVAGDRVYLASADEATQVQALHGFDRATGKPLWTTVIHRDGMTQKTNRKETWASGTPACDGERIFMSFVHGDAVFTTALDRDGNPIWQTRISDFVVHQGYGASPAVWEDLVIVAADSKGEGGGAVCGLDRTTGAVVWRNARPAKPNYASPVILHAAGKPQLFLTGVDRVTSLDPLTGKTFWEIDGATTECVTSTVTDGVRIFTSGGYPKNHVAAVAADGSGTVAWETKDRVYVPSMLVRDGHLYAVMDSGVAICWDSATGAERWKERLGGTFSSSPAMVGDRIYAANESGEMFVFRARPDRLEILGQHRIADEIFSSPAIADGCIYLRVAVREGETRREKLVCYGR